MKTITNDAYLRRKLAEYIAIEVLKAIDSGKDIDTELILDAIDDYSPL